MSVVNLLYLILGAYLVVAVFVFKALATDDDADDIFFDISDMDRRAAAVIGAILWPIWLPW